MDARRHSPLRVGLCFSISRDATAIAAQRFGETIDPVRAIAMDKQRIGYAPAGSRRAERGLFEIERLTCGRNFAAQTS